MPAVAAAQVAAKTVATPKVKLAPKKSATDAKAADEKPFEQALNRAGKPDESKKAEESKPQQRAEQPKRSKRDEHAADASAERTEARPTEGATPADQDEPTDDAAPQTDATGDVEEHPKPESDQADDISPDTDSSLLATIAVNVAPAAEQTTAPKADVEKASENGDGAKPVAAKNRATVQVAAEAAEAEAAEGAEAPATGEAKDAQDEAADETAADADAQALPKTVEQAQPATSRSNSAAQMKGELAVQPVNEGRERADSKAAPDSEAGAIELPEFVERLSDVADELVTGGKHVGSARSHADPVELLGADVPKTTSTPHNVARAVAPEPTPPEQQFAADNHPNIVNSVRSTLLPSGGTMQIRLDPPDLGQMQISVSLRDGVMSASFETSNAEATRLLSHSLSQLKGVLESQGVSVDKLHVTQAPRNENASSRDGEGSNQHQQGGAQDSPARREQERRELLQRMWRKLTEGSDPLDMVA